jgi:hypothetical protein
MPHHRRHLCRVTTVATGLRGIATTTPTTPRYRRPTLLRCYCPRASRETLKERSTRIYGYTQRYSSDPNIGTRARLPVCNPNPNQVKAKRKRDRGWHTSLEPGHQRHHAGKRCCTAVLTGARQEQNRSSSDLRKEEQKGSPILTLTR